MIPLSTFRENLPIGDFLLTWKGYLAISKEHSFLSEITDSILQTWSSSWPKETALTRNKSSSQGGHHRITGQPRLVTISEDHQVQLFMGKGGPRWDYLAPGPIAFCKPPVKGICHVLGKIAQVIDCSHCKKNSFCYQEETSPRQFVPLVLYLFHVGPCEERASILSVASL